MTTLDDAQKQKVKSWIEDGLPLSEIQNKIASELGVRMTYMDVRLLVADLGVKPKDKDVPPATPLPTTPPPPPARSAPAPVPSPLAGGAELPMPSNVSVKVDQVARAGTLVSGKVTFSDGQSAEWSLDQYGRLGLASQQPGYKPSQTDLMAFQDELQQELARQGY